MNILIQSQIQSQAFFFISSVGFIILGIMAVIFLFYLISSTRTLSRIMNKLEKDVDELGDTTEELIEEMKENVIFQFLFGKKKKHRKAKSN